MKNKKDKEKQLKVLRLNCESWALFLAQPAERDKIKKAAKKLKCDLIVYNNKILWSK